MQERQRETKPAHCLSHFAGTGNKPKLSQGRGLKLNKETIVLPMFPLSRSLTFPDLQKGVLVLVVNYTFNF